MPKRVSFGGRTHAVANISLMERHGERKKIHSTANQHVVPLTSQGKKDSFHRGAALPKDMKLKTYFSPILMARQTAHHVHNGHVSAGGIAAKYKRKKRLVLDKN